MFIHLACCACRSPGGSRTGPTPDAVGTTAILLADAASFLALGFGVLLLSARRSRHHTPRIRSRWQPISGPAATYASVLMFISTTNVAEVFLIKDAVGAGDGAYGLVVAC